jgi:hypothetical protein
MLCAWQPYIRRSRRHPDQFPNGYRRAVKMQVPAVSMAFVLHRFPDGDYYGRAYQLLRSLPCCRDG